jgi:dynein heavy chain
MTPVWFLQVRADAKKDGVRETQDALFAYFLERVRTNLHVVLCLSPIGEAFRERCRMFPGLVNCTTIDWFIRWPSDALFEVASRLLHSQDVGSSAIREAICKVFVTAHESVTDTSTKMFSAIKRRNYVTPTNYLEFVNGYNTLLREKKKSLNDKASKLRGGLTKLDETTIQVSELQVRNRTFTCASRVWRRSTCSNLLCFTKSLITPYPNSLSVHTCPCPF